jgi:hypothetical protein
MQVTDYLLGFLALLGASSFVIIVAQALRCRDLQTLSAKMQAKLREWQVYLGVKITKAAKNRK